MICTPWLDSAAQIGETLPLSWLGPQKAEWLPTTRPLGPQNHAIARPQHAEAATSLCTIVGKNWST
jgi:hypothetical protein